MELLFKKMKKAFGKMISFDDDCYFYYRKNAFTTIWNFLHKKVKIFFF